ncbi:MAG: class D sortase [Clostridia bacterium]|nr:class D sortase [Clostridia bacterium]
MISIILFFILNQINSHLNFSFQKAVLKAGFTVNSENQSKIEKINLDLEASTKEESWYLEIPSIYLKATIKEGTTKEIMDQFIGHFEESKKWTGNICLAAHNRGYENNYFAEIKKLKEGDKILYYYQGNSKEYIVEKNEIIQDTDVSCLENTEDNVITLITCVENEPNYRRCVKAIEKIN